VPITNSESKLALIEINAQRSDVIRNIGMPSNVRGATTLENGSTLQIDEYKVYSKGASWFAVAFCPLTLTLSCWVPAPRFEETYWVQYVNGRVFKWGKAGDWQANVTSDITIHNK
jgi:hypothetical protein